MSTKSATDCGDLAYDDVVLTPRESSRALVIFEGCDDVVMLEGGAGGYQNEIFCMITPSGVQRSSEAGV